MCQKALVLSWRYNPICRNDLLFEAFLKRRHCTNVEPDFFVFEFWKYLIDTLWEGLLKSLLEYEVNKHPLSTWSHFSDQVESMFYFARSMKRLITNVDLLLQNENNPHTNDLLLEWLQLLQQEAMMCLSTLSKIGQNCLNLLIKKRKRDLAALGCCGNWHKLPGNLWVCWGRVKGAGGEIGVLAVCI